MAQLRDTVVDGNLEVTNDISLKTNSKSIKSIHPNTGVESRMLHMSEYGNTVVGYDGWVNENGNTHLYGNDVFHYIAKADDNFRPYYRAEDEIKFSIRTAGYVTSSGKNVSFTVPITKPVIGSPNATATSGNGFILRQGDAYTHKSSYDSTNGYTYTTPTKYTVDSNYNSGFVITAEFDNAENVTNNDAIGIYWDGTITLS